MVKVSQGVERSPTKLVVNVATRLFFRSLRIRLDHNCGTIMSHSNETEEPARTRREPFPDETATLANYKKLGSLYWDFAALVVQWGYYCLLKGLLRLVELMRKRKRTTHHE